MNRGAARAWELLRLRRAAEAAAAARLDLEQDPDDHEALAVLGIAQYYLGRGAEGVASVERALALAPDQAHGHFLLGWLQDALGAPRKAVVSVVRAITIDAGHAPAHALLAELRQQAGRFEDALASIECALALDPHDTKHQLQRAQLLRNMGRLDPARRAVAAGLQGDPAHAGLLRLQGELHLTEAATPRAAAALEASLRLRPDDAHTRDELLHALRTDHMLHRWLWRRLGSVPEPLRPLFPIGTLLLAFFVSCAPRDTVHPRFVALLLIVPTALVRANALRLLADPVARRLLRWPGRVTSLLLIGLLLTTGTALLMPSWFGSDAGATTVRLARATWGIAFFQTLAEAAARELRRGWNSAPWQ